MDLVFITVFSMFRTDLAQIICAKDVTLRGCQVTRCAGERFPNKAMRHQGNGGSRQAVGGWSTGRLKKQAGALQS